MDVRMPWPPRRGTLEKEGTTWSSERTTASNLPILKTTSSSRPNFQISTSGSVLGSPLPRVSSSSLEIASPQLSPIRSDLHVAQGKSRQRRNMTQMDKLRQWSQEKPHAKEIPRAEHPISNAPSSRANMSPRRDVSPNGRVSGTKRRAPIPANTQTDAKKQRLMEDSPSPSPPRAPSRDMSHNVGNPMATRGTKAAVRAAADKKASKAASDSSSDSMGSVSTRLPGTLLPLRRPIKPSFAPARRPAQEEIDAKNSESPQSVQGLVEVEIQAVALVSHSVMSDPSPIDVNGSQLSSNHVLSLPSSKDEGSEYVDNRDEEDLESGSESESESESDGDGERLDRDGLTPLTSLGRRPKQGTTRLHREGSNDDGRAALWDYINAFLVDWSEPPSGLHDFELLECDRQRDLPDAWATKLYDLGENAANTKEFTAALLYLIGSKGSCSNCSLSASGLSFDTCVALPSDAPQSLRDYFKPPTCCNCFLAGHSRPCAFVRSQREDTNKSKARMSEETRTGRSVSTEEPEVAESVESPRHSERVDSVASTRDLERTETLSPSSTESTSGASEKTASELAAAEITETSSPQSHSSPTPTTRVDMPAAPFNTLFAEQWEFAPGRIRAETDGIMENIAFSNAYLSQNHSVTVAIGVTVHVVTVKSCTTHQFLSDNKKLRICSVLDGKLKVKLQGQEFYLGPRGVFTVKKGPATVENWMYGDAVLQITSLED